MLAGLALVGYGAGRFLTHQLVDIHKATSEILINQKEGTGVDAMMSGNGMSRNFNYFNDEVQNQLRILRSYDLVARAIDKIDDPIDHFLVGRIKETPVEAFGDLSVEVDLDAWESSATGKALDIFVLDASSYRLVFNATGHPKDQRTFEARFGEHLDEAGMSLLVNLKGVVARNTERLQAMTQQQFRLRIRNREQRIAQFRHLFCH